jgi:hypothetical protein
MTYWLTNYAKHQLLPWTVVEKNSFLNGRSPNVYENKGPMWKIALETGMYKKINILTAYSLYLIENTSFYLLHG